MNQELEELLAKSEAAMKVPAAVSFIQSLQTLAPVNIPSLAKDLRDKAGASQPWEKSIVDLARLARNFPREFLTAIEGKVMYKHAKEIIKRVALKPEYIRHGYATAVDIENFECILCVGQVGAPSDSFNDLLGDKIATEENGSYTFMPYFDTLLYLPPVSKEELLVIIEHFGSFQFPHHRRFSVGIDGRAFSIEHTFAKVGESLNFRHWFLGGHKYSDYEPYEWEKDLGDFCLIVRFEISFKRSELGDSWKIPEYFKPRDFRLKIVLACLHEYFGLPVVI